MFRRQVYNLHSFLGIDKYKKLIVVVRSHERERDGGPPVPVYNSVS